MTRRKKKRRRSNKIKTPSDGDAERVRRRVEELEQVLEIVRGENEALEGKVTTLEEFAAKEKKYRQLWRLNCDQLSDYDAALADKEDEIVALRKWIAELEAAPSLPVVSGHLGASTTLSASVDVIGTHSNKLNVNIMGIQQHSIHSNLLHTPK